MKILLLTVSLLFVAACNTPTNSSNHNNSPCDHNKANCSNKNTNVNTGYNANADQEIFNTTNANGNVNGNTNVARTANVKK